MTGPRIGSLFSGYGGLDMGVQQVVGGSVAWHVEFADAPSQILKHHWPDVPNYGDITAVDWSAVKPVDILAGGFPCQDVSLAGRRAGLTDGTRSGLWSEYARAIDVLQPRLVVIENVRGLLSASADGAVEPDPWGVGDGATRPTLNALGAVLGDLAGLGYDTRRCGLRAADAGAPHGRYRVFIVAYPRHAAHVVRERRGELRGERPRAARSARRASGPATEDSDVSASGEWREPTPGQTEGGRPRADAGRRGGASPSDAHGNESAGERTQRAGRESAARGGNGSAADSERIERERRGDPGDVARAARQGAREGDQRQRDGHASLDRSPVAWGAYEPAIRRWEAVTGRVAPAPTSSTARNGAQRLAPEFVEWMMGLPAGHVTSPEIGLSRNDQLKALGNGVVPQQAALAVSYLLSQVLPVGGGV